MRLLVGIDDTDTIDSDLGTGRVSRKLGAQLARDHSLEWVGSVRQQLLVDPRVPYTTHNSAACLLFDAVDPPLEAIISDAGAFLRTVMADGSDPGLCVAPATAVPTAVTTFGHRVQEVVVTKEDAYGLAERNGLFLEEYGGTGDGVIGALGSVGLTAGGNDGRFVAYGDIRAYGERVSIEQLRADGIVVVDTDGETVREGVLETHDWVRPQLRDGAPTLPVERADETFQPANLQ
jgi:tRNA(Ile2) C34 agmatinyltransferase TiaS